MADFDKFLQYQKEIAEHTLQIIAKYQGQNQKPSKMSMMKTVTGILQNSEVPLHVNEIIEIAHHEYGVVFNRDSLSSALTKKVKMSNSKIVKTDPNTFHVK